MTECRGVAGVVVVVGVVAGVVDGRSSTEVGELDRNRSLHGGSNRTGGKKTHGCVGVWWWVADCDGAACADKKERREGLNRLDDRKIRSPPLFRYFRW